jgi:alkylation response protein AidB-like acyl-CoA dehydrogenase
LPEYEYIAALPLSEPNAGLDVAVHESTSLEGDEYVLERLQDLDIRGHRRFLYRFGLAPDEGGSKGSCFIVDADTAGFSAAERIDARSRPTPGG